MQCFHIERNVGSTLVVINNIYITTCISIDVELLHEGVHEQYSRLAYQ